MKSEPVFQIVGNTVAQWTENSPLIWTMQEQKRKSGLQQDPITCDLTSLQSGYEQEFLLAMKDVLIAYRHRVRLRSIATVISNLRMLLHRVQSTGFDGKARIRQIDSVFIVALHAIKEVVPPSNLTSLRQLHSLHGSDERLFDSTLQKGDFPVRQSKRGNLGTKIHQILAKALQRSTLVHILDTMETAFEEGRIDLGRYSLIRLALNIFCRPDSYRQLTLMDLRVDEHPQSGAINYFLNVIPVKSRVHNPSKLLYPLHPEVGKLLALQRSAVVEKFGHLAPQGDAGVDLGRLALFPSLRLTQDGSWASSYAITHSGMNTSKFAATYLDPIRKLTNTELTFTALRHTIGTQLAQMGCSAHTIQAVLKHATASTCGIYVDIAFEGLIDTLSDGLKPGFDEHFPVITMFASKHDSIPVERRIVSEDLETGRFETTAVCGREVACSFAPIVCYACPRFIPCYDADHSINFDVVDREIKTSEHRGLAMQHDVQRWKTIRNHIRLIVSACETKRLAVGTEFGANLASQK